MNDYAQIWNSLPFPAFILDAEDQFLDANGAGEAFLRNSTRKLRTTGVDSFFGASSVVLETLRQARAGRLSFTQYSVEVSTFGQTISANLYLNFLDTDSGEILLIVQPTGVAEKMSQSVSHLTAARSVSAMSAMLAHEIRNPLAGISGAAQLLAMNASEGDVELAELIGQEAARIGNLVDRVEHFGDQRPTVRSAINIHTILERAIVSAQAGYGSHVTYEKAFDPSLPDAAGDPDQLLQVFQNLIKNAAEALVDRRGTIRIRTSYNSGMKFSVTGQRTENLPLMVEVIDNGKGIPETLLPEIFEPFVSSKSDGTGLGLALVSKIIAGHGGLIEVASEEGRTVFTIRLPLWKAKKG